MGKVRTYNDKSLLEWGLSIPGNTDAEKIKPLGAFIQGQNVCTCKLRIYQQEQFVLIAKVSLFQGCNETHSTPVLTVRIVGH